ncbi:MAG: outer membrane protein assembly factor BamD [Verrucomicrobiota bacterium]
MLRAMIYRLMLLVLFPAAVLQFTSCGGDPTMPIMAGNNQAAAEEGEKLYQEGKAADDAGKAAKAIKLYDKMATRYPFAVSAPKARFRQAELLEQRGEIVKSFEAYDKFLTQFQGSGMYTTALNRQIAMAQSAADGDVKQSMLGLKTRLSLEKTVEMLGKVRDNAPKSAAASRAQYTIGQLNEGKKEYKDAIAAYRLLVRDQPGSKEAPEALYRVGIILTEEADRGNQSQGNLDLAKEAFNDYLIQYPGRSHEAEAKRKIVQIDSRDIQRSFDIAEFYLKTGKTESAKVYYRDIVKRTAHGDLHDKSVARLKELGG